jgi:hypothetical protein
MKYRTWSCKKKKKKKNKSTIQSGSPDDPSIRPRISAQFKAPGDDPAMSRRAARYESNVQASLRKLCWMLVLDAGSLTGNRSSFLPSLQLEGGRVRPGLRVTVH